jgi:hypothetical protein
MAGTSSIKPRCKNARHAQRTEALYEPVVRPFAGRKFSPLA